jgi:hypothetical protein
MPKLRWIAIAGFAACLGGAVAYADVDVGGDWEVQVAPDALVSPFACVFSFTQVGTSLSVVGPTGQCFENPFGSLSATGTIDPTTGVFSGSGSAGFACPVLTIAGTASTDASFTGAFTCNGLIPVSGALAGDRCGNGAVDFGETCDPRVSPICCGDQCDPRPAGIDCLNDPTGQLCIQGKCDGDGTCVYAPREGSCHDGNVCTFPDTCSGGVCVGTPRPTGDRCDLDFDQCTADFCDGTGTCAAGPCSPCCDETMGCIPAPSAGCAGPVTPKGKLIVRNRKLQWKIPNGEQTDVADFGDPTTATGYTLCLYGTFQSQSYMLMAAAAPAGGTCKTRPCWKSQPGIGFKYGDRLRTPDGLDKVALKAGSPGRAKILVKGKGENLFTQFGLPLPPVVAQLKASNGACWESVHSTGLFTSTGTIVDVQGSPSGAFAP